MNHEKVSSFHSSCKWAAVIFSFLRRKRVFPGFLDYSKRWVLAQSFPPPEAVAEAEAAGGGGTKAAAAAAVVRTTVA